MSFIDRKHAFYRIKAMLLSDKLNALIFRKIIRFCNRLISNDLQNACFLQIFVPQRAFFCRRGKTKRDFLKIHNSFQRRQLISFSTCKVTNYTCLSPPPLTPPPGRGYGQANAVRGWKGLQMDSFLNFDTPSVRGRGLRDSSLVQGAGLRLFPPPKRFS